MKKLLLIITLILPLLISSESWASSLPECEGSPLSQSNWIDLFFWDNCQGTVTYSNGQQYDGEWKDGLPNGQGTKTFLDGSKYAGEFKDNKWHGQGTYTYSNGNQYVGGYKDDLWHGQGTYTFSSGTKVEGIFKDGNFLYENIVTSNDDENFCLEIGFKRSTPEFDNCVEKTAEKD
jgi:hypothetical protein